ncbi:hypothetical protein QL285_076068 [Trifolium repens]|nr:hypothetical protein QL285_076068 [Trifolium repens]
MQRKMKKKGLATLKWWLSDQKRPKSPKWQCSHRSKRPATRTCSPSDHQLAQRPKRRAVRNTRVSKPTTEVRKLAQRRAARPASLAELN